MKRLNVVILSAIIVLSLITMYFGYRFTSEKPNQDIYLIAEACRNLCLYAKYNLSINLSSQCLSDPDTVTGKLWVFKGWVCDVAHNPRRPEDNLPENQCKEFLNGNAKNFVEVDPNCTIIRIYYNGKFII